MGTWEEALTKYAIALVDCLLLVVTLCVPILVRHLIRWLNSKRKREETEAEVASRVARQERIEGIVMTATRAVGQTYVSELKAAVADGKLTPEERKEAFAKTITMVHKHLLSEKILDVSSEILEDYIEEAVARLK